MSVASQAGDQGRLEAVVDALVRRYARAVERIASHRWRLAFTCDSGDRSVTCTAQSGWILLDEVVATVTDPATLLARNATLPRCLKVAIFADGSVHVRAELPVGEDDDPSPGLVAALCAFDGGEAGSADGAVPEAQLNLGQLCTEAG